MPTHQLLPAQNPRARVLAVSFGATLALVAGLLGAFVFVDSAEATAYTITATGGPIKDWNTPTTWSPAGVPGSAPGDTVNITTANAQVQLTTGLTNPLTSMSISGTNILVEVAGGNLSIVGSGSTVTGGATIRLISGGTLTPPGGASSLGIGSNGTLDWQNGTITSGIVVIAGGGSPGIANITGPATVDNNAQIQNNGTIAYSNGPLTLQNGASIINQGFFSLDASQAITSSGAPTPFISNTGSGQIVKSTLGTSTVGMKLLNQATVSATSGAQVELSGGGDHTGSFSAAGTARVSFSGGTHNVNNVGASFSGDVQLTNGVLAFNQPITAAQFTQTGGNLTGPASFTTSSTFVWSGGTQSGGGQTVISGGTMTIDGAVGPVTLNGHTINLNGGNANYSAPLANALSVENVGGISINSGVSSFLFLNDSPIKTSTTGLFNNASGLVRKTGGTATNEIQINFINQNQVINQVSGGSIAFKGGGNNSGALQNTNPTGTIDFTGGVFQFDVGTTLSANGFFRILDTGTVELLTTVVADFFVIDGIGATLTTAPTGAHALNINTVLDFKQGFITRNVGTLNPGSTTINSTAQVAIGATGIAKINGWTITNNGQINLNGPFNLEMGNTANIQNESGAIMRLVGDYSISAFAGSPVINNKSGAQFLKTTGSVGGISTIHVQFDNAGDLTNFVDQNAIRFASGGTQFGTALVSMNGGPDSLIEFHTTPYNLNGGSFTGPGAVLLTSGGLVVNANTGTTYYRQNGGSLQGTATFAVDNGGFWFGGSITGGLTNPRLYIDTPGTFGITGPGSLDNAILQVGGILVYAPVASLNVQNNGQIHVLNGARMELQNDIGIGAGTGTNTLLIDLGGTVEKTGISGSTPIALAVTNNGDLISTIGRIDLGNGGVNTGSMQTTASSDIRMSGNTFQWNGGTFTGGGLLVLDGSATLMLNAPLSVPRLTVNAGSISGASTLATTTSFTWFDGSIIGPATANFSGTNTIQPGSSPTFLTDTDVTFSGNTNYFGTSATNGLQLSGGASITNSGTFILQGDRPIFGTAAQIFDNNGTFRKAGGTGVSAIGTTFNNNAGVEAQSGEIAFLQGGTDTGSYTSTGGDVEFAGGTRTLSGTASIGPSFSGVLGVSGSDVTVGGVYSTQATVMTSGSLTFNGVTPAGLDDLTLIGGTIGGTAAANLSGNSFWLGGTITGSNTLTIAGGTNVTIGGGSGTLLDGRAVTNDGNVLFNSATPFTMSNGAVWSNGGTGVFDIATGQPVMVGSGLTQINNSGVFRKSGGASSLIQPPFANANLIEAQVNDLNFAGGFTQTGGLTTVGPGSLSSSFGPMQFNGGDLKGNGTIGSMVNAANVRPGTSPGKLSVNGSYTQTASGTLFIELGGTTPGTGYDQLEVNGAANLGGTLDVTFFGGFQPSGGQVFEPVRFASRTGDFITPYTLPAWAGTWSPSYTANALQLLAVAPAADLSITQVAPPTVPRGTNFNVVLTATNNGPNAASSVVVTDTYSNLTVVSANSTIGSCTPGPPANTYTCAIGTLNSGQSATITFVFNAPTAGNATNAASITSAATESDPTDNSTGTANITVQAVGDMSVGVTDTPDPVAAGSNVTYTVVVANSGPDNAPPSSVNVTINNGGTVFSVSAGCTVATASSVNCTVPALTAGTTTPFTIVVATPTNQPNVTATATHTPSIIDGNLANNTAAQTTTITANADVSITKTGTTNAHPGETIVYTIVVTNNGPSTATGVQVNDPTPAGLTFVANAGGCNTPYPCTLGTMNPGQSVTIQSTYNVDSGATGSATNTATVTATSADGNGANNSASATTTFSCPGAPTVLGPANGATNVPLHGALGWNHTGATAYRVFFGPASSNGCTTFYGNALDNFIVYSDLQPNTEYEFRVEVQTSGCPTETSACARFRTISTCNTAPPTLTAPANGASVGSPVTFTWTAVTGATQYEVFANGTSLGTTGSTSLSASLPDGPVTWFVVATGVSGCGPLQSANGTFTACTTPAAPLASVVAETTSGQTYTLSWDPVPGAARYEVDEATNAAFNNVTTISTTATSLQFTKVGNSAQPFFYRVRAFAACNGAAGLYSPTVRVVVLPPPAATDRNPNANVPAGSCRTVVQQVFVPGVGTTSATFTATVDKPWMTVTPSSGPLPLAGITLSVTADPCELPNGTFTGTVIVVVDDGLPAATKGRTTTSTPVSVSLVTPVTPARPSGTPPESALIIPSVGHLNGLNSVWRSDIRVANTSSARSRVQLTFTPEDPARPTQQTTIEVDAGATTALDDIVRNWYGIGSLDEAANGMLEIRPLDGGSNVIAGEQQPPSVSTVVASSRTYNVTSNGTLGQFIPAVPFSSFIQRAGGGAAAGILSLQQISQTAAYRTNFGIVEASGQPANAVVSIYNAAGQRLRQVPLQLRAFEQRQLNGFLSQQGITNLQDGRIDVSVTSGDGRVTAYASVVDNNTGDPLLVSGVPLGSLRASRWVLPGVANLNTGGANWRTDMRLFNSGTSSQSAQLTFYPEANASNPSSTVVTLAAGEVRTLDNILPTVFSQTGNVGGAVHVITPNETSLVVTGRTYNQTTTGTFGQFIPAVTPNEAIALGGRSLEILQVEDSVRYRTNVGIAETSGRDTVVELTVNLPDTRVTPKITVPLAANEFKQLPLLRGLNLGNVYNARITVRVVEGQGRVTAYGSVIDQLTNDPTYIPAQQ